MERGAEIVTLGQNKEVSFIDALSEWLVQTESILRNNHRPQLGEIAGIRAQLFAASGNVYDKRVVSLPTTGGARKNFHAYAALLLSDTQAVMARQFEVFAGMRADAEKFTRQIVLIAVQKNAFYPIWSGTQVHSIRLVDLWSSFVSDPDLVQGTRQILAAVSYADALRILDEIIVDMRL